MANFKQARFVGSFPQYSQLPPDEGTEIAVVGRSNVGKSSLINALTHRKNLAKSSSTPGKTREIVLFELDPAQRLSDLPGYGYAKVSQTEQRRWGKELMRYLQERQCLKAMVLIMDMRHPLTDLDRQMLQILRETGKALVLVLNKSDKLKQGEQVKARRTVEDFLKELKFPAIIVPFSAEKKRGVEELRELLAQWFEQ